MFKLSKRSDSKTLYFEGTYLGFRCREYTGQKDSRENRRLLNLKLKQMNSALQVGSFRYHQYFPDSKQTKEIALAERDISKVMPGSVSILPKGFKKLMPTIIEFGDIWQDENKLVWRKTHRESIDGIMSKYVNRVFGDMPVDTVKREHLINFRAQLGDKLKANGEPLLSNGRINKIMSVIRQLLNEAAIRYEFITPYQNIKQLKNNPKDIQPFSLSEASMIIDKVRPDYRNYYITRFFTGMRTSEIDGLQWKYVDFEKRLILIRETLVDGTQEKATKTHSSSRDIQLGDRVIAALQNQYKATNAISDYVFCNVKGQALAHRNVTRRVWRPLLNQLGFEYRKPYQTRHTAATLWLAAGESPEWIAKQLGHANTMMLFTVYSRYVPNLTRKDGSAFESLLDKHLED